MNTVQDGFPHDGGITRASILDAASDLLQADGWERFSMRKLAVCLECAPGTVYLYFTNKADLLQCAMDNSFDRLQETLCRLRERRRDGDPVVLLRKALYTYVEFGLHNPKVYELAFSSQGHNRGVQRQPGLVIESLRSMVARCVYEDAFRAAVDVDCTTQALWAAVHGVTSLLTNVYVEVGGRSKLIEEVISNALDGLIAAQKRRAAGLTA